MLLNKHNLAIATHAMKKDLRPILNSICITPTHTVATDSYRLLEVELPGIEKGSAETQGQEQKSIGLPLEIAKAISSAIPKKPITPEAELVDIKLDAGVISLSTETTKMHCGNIEGKFPDYESILTREQPRCSIGINATYLKEMAAFFEKATDDIARIDIEFYSPLLPLVFRATTPEKQKIRGLIMPLRVTDEKVYNPIYEEAYSSYSLLKEAVKALPKDKEELIKNINYHLDKLNPKKDESVVEATPSTEIRAEDLPY